MLIRGNVATRAAYIDTVRFGQCQTAPLPVPVSTITLDTLGTILCVPTPAIRATNI